ncbi:unnamed protein product, partial [Rotaria sp. Silwood1]
VEQRFEEEIRRVESYLHPSTLAPLMKNLERVLIHEQLEAIYTQAKALLHDENYSDFACLFKLVGRVPNAIVQLKKFLKTIFIQKAWGNFINNNPITEAANNARKSAHFSTRACSTGLQYNTTRPSIPPQLALVIPAVSLLVDWEDFTQELKVTNPDIINAIRLKNKSQHPIRAVKLEFMSVKARNEILEAGEISALHLKKSCPQKNESTCKTCGERSTNLKDHNCSSIPKCIRCGEAHVSNDQKCKIVQQYRATLTRNLLANVITAAH